MSTIQMRIADRRDAIRMGDKRRLDTDAITGLRKTIADLTALNRDLWEMIRDFGYPQ